MRNGQAYQQKTEKFSVSEEKKFGKIDSRMETTAFKVIKHNDKYFLKMLQGQGLL